MKLKNSHFPNSGVTIIFGPPGKHSLRANSLDTQCESLWTPYTVLGPCAPGIAGASYATVSNTCLNYDTVNWTKQLKDRMTDWVSCAFLRPDTKQVVSPRQALGLVWKKTKSDTTKARIHQSKEIQSTQNKHKTKTRFSRFLMRDPMHSQYCVCPSVTSRCSTKTAICRIT